MSAPPYMKLYWGDYHKATRHLRRDQHGAYFLLIGEAWRLGGTLPDDDGLLAAWALCTAEEWAAMKTVIMAFFDLRRGKWVHDRVREELSSYESTSRKRKEAGRLGGNANRGKDTENLEAIATQKPIKPEPEPEPKKEISDAIASSPSPSAVAELFPTAPKAEVARKSTAYPPEFDAAWKAYPHHPGRSSKPMSLERWKKLPAAERDGLVAAIGQFSQNVETTCGGKGAPDMAKWLKDGKHLNWTTAASGGEQARTAVFSGPPGLRAAVVAAEGEKFAIGYLDPCGWQEVPYRAVIARNDYQAGLIVKAIGAQLDRAGVRVIVNENQKTA